MNNCCSLRLSTAGIVVGLFYSTILLLTTILFIEYFIDFVFFRKLENPSGIITTTTLILIFSLAGCISSGLLVYGTFKRRHFLLPPWLVFAIALILFIGIILFYCIYVLFAIICNKRRFDYTVFIEILLIIALLALQIYLWLCIRSLHQQIRTEFDEQKENADITLENYRPLQRNTEDFIITTDIQ